MAHAFDRRVRVADLIKQELGKLILEQSQDPRFAFVSINSVEIARDYSNAKVYVTLLNDNCVKETIKALNKAAGFFRTKLAKQINLRSTPKLHFIFDESLLQGLKISQLLKQSLDPSKE